MNATLCMPELVACRGESPCMPCTYLSRELEGIEKNSRKLIIKPRKRDRTPLSLSGWLVSIVCISREESAGGGISFSQAPLRWSIDHQLYLFLKTHLPLTSWPIFNKEMLLRISHQIKIKIHPRYKVVRKLTENNSN